jgi:hypothetical protein
MMMLLAPQAPNIMAMIQRFNVVSRWVATEIVQVEDLTARASVLNHFLEIMNVRVVCVCALPSITRLHVSPRDDAHSGSCSDAWSSTTSTAAWRSSLAFSRPQSIDSDRRGRYACTFPHARTHAHAHTTYHTLVAYLGCGATAHR